MNNQLGAKLKELRGNASLRETAKKIGVSHTYLCTLEIGTDPRNQKVRVPSIETLRKVAFHYKISLVGLLISAEYISEEDIEIYNNVKQGDELK